MTERPRHAALIVVHGIGAQRRNWADAFIDRVRRETARRTPGVTLHAAPVHWTPVVQEAQEALLARVARGLGWTWLRGLVIGHGGDVVAYQSPPKVWMRPAWTYRAVHDRIHRRLVRLLREVVTALGAFPSVPIPLVVVAHSLGSVIFSDFVYVLQSGVAPPRGFERQYHLALRTLVTLGSPLALFALRASPVGGFESPIALGSGARWVNLLYRADPIAYPLAPTGAAYAELVEDVRLRARPWSWQWTPLAHGSYWRDRRVVRRVADAVARAALP